MGKKKQNLITETLKVYTDNEMSVYAGYATLYILMAMVPLLTLVIGLVNILPDVSLQHLEVILLEILPDIQELRSLLHNIIANVDRQAGTLAVSVSAIASLWSASNGVNALQMGLCKINGSSGSFIKRRVAALLYTLVFIALIPALLIFRVLRGSIEDLIAAVNRWLNIPDIAGRLLEFMEYSGLITAIVMAVVILLIDPLTGDTLGTYPVTPKAEDADLSVDEAAGANLDQAFFQMNVDVSDLPDGYYIVCMAVENNGSAAWNYFDDSMYHFRIEQGVAVLGE